MKTLLSIFILVWLMVLIGCKSVEEPAPVPEKMYGTASCYIDGVKWNAVVEPVEPSVPNGNNYLTIQKTTTNQAILFGSFKLEVGKKTLLDWSSPDADENLVRCFYIQNTSSDVVEFWYRLLEMDTIDNYFEITAVDQENKKLTGKFQAVFERVEPSMIDTMMDTIVLDTLYVLDGEFETNIK